MPASSRQLASASVMMASNTLPRWLCSMMPMPLSRTFQISCWAFLSTLSGSTAGPALKLKIRSVMALFPCSGAVFQAREIHLDHVRVARGNRGHGRLVRLGVQVNARERGLRAVIDDVFDFFHVDAPLGQYVEHMGQHAGPVPMPDREHVGRRALGLAVDAVGHAALLEITLYDPDHLVRDGHLGLLGRGTDMMGDIDARFPHQRILRGPAAAGRLLLEDVEPHPDATGAD